MKKIPLISVIVFIILSISFIIYQNFSSDSFGSEFVEQIRIADAEDTLDNIPENTLINIGKNICISSVDWIDVETSENLIRASKSSEEYSKETWCQLKESPMEGFLLVIIFSLFWIYH